MQLCVRCEGHTEVFVCTVDYGIQSGEQQKDENGTYSKLCAESQV